MSKHRPIRLTITEARLCLDALDRRLRSDSSEHEQKLDRLYWDLKKKIEDENDALHERHKAKQS